MGVEKLESAGRDDKTPGEGDPDRLRVVTPFGQRMRRGVVGIVEVTMLDVQASASNEPGRNRQRSVRGHFECIREGFEQIR